MANVGFDTQVCRNRANVKRWWMPISTERWISLKSVQFNSTENVERTVETDLLTYHADAKTGLKWAEVL